MAALLDREEVVDEFYSTTYGGFADEVDDNDYTSEDSSGSADETDSDFSIDENDEPVSDDNEDDDRKRRSHRRSAYREPKPAAKCVSKPVETKAETNQSRSARRSQSESTSSPLKARVSPKKFRESTRRNARETEHRLRVAQREAERRRKAGQKVETEYRQLTQAEMLREARKTEVINIKSLERYQKLELEKSKKNKVVKEVPKGPYVRYQSVTMPLIQEIDSLEPNDEDQDQSQDQDQDPDPDQDKAQSSAQSLPKCSRTFISFTDDETFREHFPTRKVPQPKQKLFCPISHLPGRYFDPVSLLPYSSAPTFRAIREAYYKQLEQLGDQRQPEVAKWVQWRKRTASHRPNIQPRIIRIIK